jgi:1-acyl-sn-glycerol-3-phosphate acyltransferase
MLSFLPPPVLGLIVTSLFISNTLFWAAPIYVVIAIKLIPVPVVRRACTYMLHFLCNCWLHCNVFITETAQNIQWEIRGTQNLRPDAQYLVISNHQSWNDIYVAMRAMGGKVPFFKFFIKQELIWVPVLGLVWWALDYPFMKRYSAAQLRARPELAGEDMKTAKKSCEKYIGMPVTVLNYAEGTRFTPIKREKQNSPYKHLLRPKTGGLAFAAAAMGPQVNTVLDVTVVYLDGAKGFWDFMCGRNKRIVVDIKTRQIPPHWYTSNYQQDPEFRRDAQAWVAGLWAEKDALIERELAKAGA